MNPKDQHTPHIFPLSAAQRGIWNAQQLSPGSPYYVVGEVLELNSTDTSDDSTAIDVPALVQAITHTVEESDTLRAQFCMTEGDAVSHDIAQYVSKEIPDIHVHSLEQASDPEILAHAMVDTFKASAAQRWGKITDTVLHQYQILILNPQKVWVVQLYHHIIVDGYSAALLTKRISSHYAHAVTGKKLRSARYSPLEHIVELDTQYRASEYYTADVEYWTRNLTPLPSTADRESYVHGDAPLGITTTVHIDSEEFQNISRSAHEYGVSWTEIFLAAYIVWLQHALPEVAHENTDTHVCEQTLALPVMARPDTERLRTPCMQVNMLPLVVRFEKDDTIVQIASTLREKLANIRQHQLFPGSDISVVLQEPQAASLLHGIGVNTKIFDFQLDFPGLDARLRNVAGGPPEDLVLVLTPDGHGGLDCAFETDPTHTPAHVAMQRLEEIVAFVRTALQPETAQIPQSRIDIHSYEQNQQYLRQRSVNAEQNDTILHNHTHPMSLDELIEQLVLAGDKPTLSDAQKSLNAQELWDSIMHSAQQLCAAPEGKVVVLEESKSVHMAVMILAALYAHRPFVVLDPALPEERRRSIVENLAQESEDGNFSPETAYILYTSGTTGRPKGVEVSRSAVEHLIDSHLKDLYPDAWSRVAPGEQLTVAHTAEFSFDAALDQLFWLFSGAHVHMVTTHELKNPQELFATLDRAGVSVLDTTPSYAQAVEEYILPRMQTGVLSTLVLGGEAISQSLWDTLAVHVSETDTVRSAAWNMYGPTEATIDALSARITPGAVTLGRAIPGMQAYALNRYGALTSDYEVGELYLSGPQLAEGYVRNPEATRKVFVETPQDSPLPAGMRLYRTGDLVRWIPGRGFQFLGRKDQQVEVRGHRVELQDVQHTLESISGIKQAYVWIWNGVIAAALVLDKEYASPLVPALLADTMRNRLPEYMRPQKAFVVENVPLTSSGKPHQGELEKMFTRWRTHPGQDAVQTTMLQDYPEEHRVVFTLVEEHIKHTLGVDTAEWNQSFLEQGGDSISAIKLMSALKYEGIEVPVREILSQEAVGDIVSRYASTHSTVLEEKLTGGVGQDDFSGQDSGKGTNARIPHVKIPYMQMHHMESLGAGWVDLPVKTSLILGAGDDGSTANRGGLNLEQLQRAVDYLLAEYPVLRTVAFYSAEGDDVDLYLPRTSAAPASESIALNSTDGILSAQRGQNLIVEIHENVSGTYEPAVDLWLNKAVVPEAMVSKIALSLQHAYSGHIHSGRWTQQAWVTNWKKNISSVYELCEQTHEDNLDDAIVQLKQGAGIPIFTIPAADGEAVPYAFLAEHIPGDRPLYAVQVTMQEQVKSEDIAQEYVRYITSVQPYGPYTIVGFSSGGAMAERIGARLEQQGKDVGHVVIIDSYPLGVQPTIAGVLDKFEGYTGEEVFEKFSLQEIGAELGVAPEIIAENNVGEVVVKSTFFTGRMMSISGCAPTEQRYTGPLTVIASSVSPHTEWDPVREWGIYRQGKTFDSWKLGLDHAEFVTQRGWAAMMDTSLKEIVK